MDTIVCAVQVMLNGNGAHSALTPLSLYFARQVTL
jgi:hypothetical protein